MKAFPTILNPLLGIISLSVVLACGCSPRLVYDNPVIPRNCPDPSILDNRARDGWFYACSTRSTIDGKAYDIPVYRSRDLISWELAGAAFTPGGSPSWEPKGALWAPNLNYIDGKYVLYYALGVWGDHDRSASGVAVSNSPSGPFKDLGMIVSRENTGVGNSIDPAFFQDTDGRKYLYWGSLAHPTDGQAGRLSGIFVVELSDDGCSLRDGAEPVKVAGDMMEGVFVHKRGRYYYLFASEGSCCVKENSTYHVVVGRSESPLGPFTSRSGMPMTAGAEGIYDGTILVRDADSLFCGPGHDSRIVKDDRGRDWMAYHAYWKGNGYKGRCMNLDRVYWTKDGWPYFKNGSPSASAEAPVFRKRKASGN